VTTRIGRPPRNGTVAKKRVEIRLTASEWRALRDMAGAIPVGVWMREVALKIATRTRTG
jgi:hypothetical protein